MRIAVAREVDANESRVAATPETVKKMRGLGANVCVEPSAGVKSGIPDTEFTAAGATVASDAVKDADVILKVRRPTSSELAGYTKGALVIAIMDPYGQDAALRDMANAGVVAFAMVDQRPQAIDIESEGTDGVTIDLHNHPHLRLSFFFVVVGLWHRYSSTLASSRHQQYACC